MFFILTSDNSGSINPDYNYLSLGRSGYDFYLLKDLIKFDKNILLLQLPDRVITAKEIKTKKNKTLDKKFLPVAAVLPPGYLRIYFPAYKLQKKAEFLPFFAYTAAAISKDNEIYASALKVEDNFRWNPSQFNTSDLKQLIKEKQQKYPRNRIIKHLSGCALNYNCYTAQNIFYNRWEGAIPTTSTCNARCVGCISLQNKLVSPQSRIKFTPSVSEISEVGINHLKNSESIISFGQGCEGDPILSAPLISRAVKNIRAKTNLGIININTNGSLPKAIKFFIAAGVDSFRISLNSLIDSHYKKYFRGLNYSLKEVTESIKIIKSSNRFVWLNLLVLPGATDGKKETEKLINFVEKYKVDMLQLRNLNIDPDLYYKKVHSPIKDRWGIENWYKIIQKSIPLGVKLGAFNPSNPQ